MAARLIIGLDHLERGMVEGASFEGARIVAANPSLGFLVVETDDASAFRSNVEGEPRVVYVENDTFDEWMLLVPDEAYPNEYGPILTRAREAWDITVGDAGVAVCIVDTGVNYSHNDIRGPRWLGGYDFVSGDADPFDNNGHGSHVAGIALATINNQKGIAGMAQASILAAKVLDATGSGYMSNVASGIQWCVDRGADIINLSLGGSSSSVLAAAVDYAWDRDVVVVAAAGNDGCDGCVLYPAAYENAVAVACVDWESRLCEFSSRGPEVDIAAPGKYVRSIWNNGDNSVRTVSGTSMSAPHVAGAAALVRSAWPSVSNGDVRRLLLETAVDLGVSGPDTSFGNGLLDAAGAIGGAARPVEETPILSESFDDGVADAFTLSGLWRVDDECYSTVSSPYHLGYHRAGACDYNTFPERTVGDATFTVDLSGYLSATLQFEHVFDVENDDDEAFDVMRVEARPPGGTWTTHRQWDSRDGSLPGWTHAEVSLGAHVGGPVEIRFRFDSIDALSNGFPGWYIDDVAVGARGNSPPTVVHPPTFSAKDHDASGSEIVHLIARAADFDGDAIASVAWKEGAVLLAPTLEANVSLATGTHALTLTVTDAAGMTSTTTATVTVFPNVAPVVDAGPPIEVSDGDSNGTAAVTFAAASFSDADGSVVAIEWSEGGATLGQGVPFSRDFTLGTHEVTLTVTDDGGAMTSDSVAVTVIPDRPPTVHAGLDRFVADGNGNGTEAVILDGRATTDADGTPVLFGWFEGEVQVAAGALATAELALGPHTITLRVTDDGGAVGTDTVNVTITTNAPPVARAGSDVRRSDGDGTGREPIALDGRASTDQDGIVVAYAWSVGAVVLSNAANATLEFGIGRHEVLLTVTDSGGLWGQDEIVVTIDTNAAPTADAGPDVNASDPDGSGDAAVVLDGRASRDADGQVASYAWTESGAPIATGSRPSVRLPVGLHDITLTVTDNGGAIATDSVTVLIAANSLPSARAGPDIEGRDADGSGTHTVTLRDDGSNDADGQLVARTWFEDEIVLGSGATLSHTFSVGIHDVTLEVRDNGGGTGRDRLVVNILPNAIPTPVAYVVCDELHCRFDSGESFDEDGSIVSRSWSFGDGNTSTGVSPEHEYVVVGNHTWSLTVWDNGGATSSLEGWTGMLESVPRAPGSGVPANAVAFDRSRDAGDVSRVPSLDVEAAWFEADTRRLYAGLKTHAGEDDITQDLMVEFGMGWPVPDPTWGGIVPDGAQATSLRLRADLDGPQDVFELRVVHSDGLRSGSALIAEVEGSYDADRGITWWVVDRALLQSPPTGALLLSPTGKLAQDAEGLLVIDSTGAGRSFPLKYTARALRTVERFNFNATDEGFVKTSDVPESEATWDPASGSLLLVSDPVARGNDETFTRPFASPATDASGSFVVNSTWRIVAPGANAYFAPLYVGPAVTRFESTSGLAYFGVRTQGAGSTSTLATCTMTYRDAGGVARLAKTYACNPSATYDLSIAYASSTRTLTMSILAPGGAVLSSGSYALSPSEGFSFASFGGAADGRMSSGGQRGVGLVDDVVVTLGP